MKRLWSACVALVVGGLCCGGVSELDEQTTTWTDCGVGLVTPYDGQFNAAERAILDAFEQYGSADSGVHSYQVCHDLYDWHVGVVDAGEFTEMNCWMADGGTEPCQVYGKTDVNFGVVVVAKPLGRTWGNTALAHEYMHVIQWMHGRQIDYEHKSWGLLGLFATINAANAAMADGGI
jgi:hypothetical protein